jgi:hypothetical protein
MGVPIHHPSVKLRQGVIAVGSYQCKTIFMHLCLVTKNDVRTSTQPPLLSVRQRIVVTNPNHLLTK